MKAAKEKHRKATKKQETSLGDGKGKKFLFCLFICLLASSSIDGASYHRETAPFEASPLVFGTK